jgi:hypothetical protein
MFTYCNRVVTVLWLWPVSTCTGAVEADVVVAPVVVVTAPVCEVEGPVVTAPSVAVDAPVVAVEGPEEDATFPTLPPSTPETEADEGPV